MSGAISLCRKRGGFLVAHALSHHGPGHPGELVGESDCSDLSRAPCQQCCEPRPMLRTVDLRVADHGERADREQASQIAITPLADIAEPFLASARVLLWDESDPGRKVAP